MGFWVLLLTISTVLIYFRLSDLRSEYEKTTSELKEEISKLKKLIESFKKAEGPPVVEKRAEEQVPETVTLPIMPPSLHVSESLPVEVHYELAEEQIGDAAEEVGVTPPMETVFAFSESQPESAEDEYLLPEEPVDTTMAGLLRRWERFKENVDWEFFTGVKLFAGLGGIALFIGAGFFVKYSIDRNLIPPAMRLAISAIIGMALIISSDRFDRIRYSVLRHTLGAGGIGVLYSVVFAATLYYEYLSRPMGFGLLMVVSAAAFALSVYYGGIPIAVLGAIGAYITPVLVTTGQGTLSMLFIYLAIVNVGLFEVVKRLNSSILLLLATIGTLCTLFFGAFLGRVAPLSIEIAYVWIANMALFSAFLGHRKENPDNNQLILWAGGALYASVPLVALLLVRESGVAPLLLVTSGMAGAVVLAYVEQGWFKYVIPFGAVTFCVAFVWALLCFDPQVLSWSFLVILIYGAVGGLGPVVLIRKYGLDMLNLRWFRVFPVAMGLMTLAVVLKNPNIAFWFWPVILALELLGLLISIFFGALFQAALLIIFFIICGFSWGFRMPPDLGGPLYLGFIFVAGIISIVVIAYVVKKLPEWRLDLAESDAGMLPEISSGVAEWLSVFPAAGAFILLAVAFLLKRPLDPNPGMFTLVCFLGLSLFLSRRLAFQSLCITVMLSALFSQGVWILRPDLDINLFFNALAWSGTLFCIAVLSPFLFFTSFEKWSRVWMTWALYEVVQGLFVIWAADHVWAREFSGWSPLVLAFIKLPVASVLQKRLEGLPQRNAILAFHGGVLLFYVSAIPVMLLDQGWLGLTFVIEATLLLWLNGRVVHEGLRWVSSVMAPLGITLLLFALPQMKSPGDMIILNRAVMAVAAAVLALSAAVPLSSFPDRRLAEINITEYFRWLAVGLGFFLLNLCIADLFAGPHEAFRVLSGTDPLQAICYGLVWLVYGAVIWSTQSIPWVMRSVGLLLVCSGVAGIIVLPLIFPSFVPGLPPLWNIGLSTYLFVLGVLFIIMRRILSEGLDRNLYNLLLALFLVVGFMAVKVEMSTFVQPGLPFHLFFRHTPAMAVGSAAGWMAYGLGLLFWPRGLDKPFRTAGVILFIAGLTKALAFPFTHADAFGSATPLMNYPTLLWLWAIGILACLALDKPPCHWPFDNLPRRLFWGVLLAVATFCVLNIEISSVFSLRGRSFSLLTYGSLSHQLAYSLGWLIYSIGLLTVGISWKSNKVRWAALLFIVATSLKIFFMDLWRLGQLYRVASFIGLAAVLILVSFLYQRLLPADKENSKGQES